MGFGLYCKGDHRRRYVYPNPYVSLSIEEFKVPDSLFMKAQKSSQNNS